MFASYEVFLITQELLYLMSTPLSLRQLQCVVDSVVAVSAVVASSAVI